MFLGCMLCRYTGLSRRKCNSKFSSTFETAITDKIISFSTLVTNRRFLIGAFLIIPLPSVFAIIDVDLHTKLCAVVVVGLVLCPRLVADPRAVVAQPGPGFTLVGFGDSNPIIWTLSSVWQHRDEIVILLLALDDHHVFVIGLAVISSLGPGLGFV